MKKSIVLCADDYGQEIEISNGIYFLLEQGVLSATSCMVTSPLWQEQGPRLKRFATSIDIGLHFNLTEGTPLSKQYRDNYGNHFFSLKELMLRANSRQLKLGVIIAELKAQLEAFNLSLSMQPDFIDGHQHVHQFPVIREALLMVYKELGLKAYLRLVDPSLIEGGIKGVVIKFSGGQKMRNLYRQSQIPHNSSFAGLYNFNNAHNYSHYFRQFLRQISHKGIIMCHPATAHAMDSIGKARFYEYTYLSSIDFQRDCLSANVQIDRWSGLSKYE